MRMVVGRPIGLIPGSVAFAAGLGVGIVLLGSAVAAIAVIGGATLASGSPGTQTMQAAFAIAVVPAFVEELVFRGVLFRLVEQALGTWVALAVSSLLFGLGHALNDDATPWSCLAIALEAGLLLAAVYLTTRRLWACIGLHLGWNLAQVLLGLTVSGNGQRAGLCSVRLLGSAAVTGGGFGPEASVVTVALLTSVGAGLLWYARRTGRFIERPGRRPGSGTGPASTGLPSAGSTDAGLPGC